jgi:lysophospholipase L1-like esterase
MEGEWTVISSNKYKNPRRPVTKNLRLSINNVNRYEPLQNNEERTTASQNTGSINNRKMIPKERKSLQKKKRKIVVVGDSFTRGMASELLHNLGSAFEVIGCVKPVPDMEVITDMAKKEISSLTKEDMVVIWGGANDIATNEANISHTHITNFVNLRKHTNIFIVSVSTRFDLITTSCVNEEVIAYNRKLYKRVKQSEHVKIDTELQRKYFTKHGMNMNRTGKEQMTQKIAEHIRETLSKRETFPMTLQWKQDSVKRTASVSKNDVETNMDEVADNLQENQLSLKGINTENSNINRDNTKGTITLNSATGCSENKGMLPKRDRKRPKTRNGVFLWF